LKYIYPYQQYSPSFWIIINHPVTDLCGLNYILAGRVKSSSKTRYPNSYAKHVHLFILHFISIGISGMISIESFSSVCWCWRNLNLWIKMFFQDSAEPRYGKKIESSG